ncbi:MAG: Gldg family protein [Candidatus Eremiobacteraeota bacterium]|nr:Gldg family protein [Candidatus Eremiobacteraeota bacterium]
MDKRLSSFLNTVISVCIALAVWVLILLISNNNTHPFDITKNGRYTLAPQSKQAVTSLTTPVKVYAFNDEKSKAKSEELLKRYSNVDPQKFTYEVVDPIKKPLLAKKFGIRMRGEGAIEIKEGKGRTERLTGISEEEITAALLKLQRNATYKAYFLTGHGERDLNQSEATGMSQLRADLVKEGFVVEPLSLTATPKIPADTNLLVLAGPIQPLLPGEQKLVKDYVDNYGRLLLLYEAETPDSYTELVKPYGIETTGNIILDQASELLKAEPVFSVGLRYDPAHAITKDYKIQTMFMLARALKTAATAPAGVIDTVLITTNPNPPTALEVPLAEVVGQTSLKIDPSKLKPSVATLAIAAEKKEEAPKASPTPAPDQAKNTRQVRVVAVADADALSNQLYIVNKDFALNSFNWLAANDTAISIRPKDELAQPLTMSGQEQTKMGFLVVLLLPCLMVGLGLFNVMRRQ